MKIKEVLNSAILLMEEHQVLEPRNSAELLMMHVLGLTRAELYANLRYNFSEIKIKLFEGYVKRRLKHEPVNQIVGKVEFWGLDFAITDDVLIPRPETEFLVEKILETIKAKNLKPKTLNLLDVGTGSGVIICSLAKELNSPESNFYVPNSKYYFFATDISKKALRVAKKNAKTLNLDKLINFIQADIFEPTSPDRLSIMPDHFDIITANLPYIPSEDLGSLSLDIHHYEPRIALDGGPGGLRIYEELIKGLDARLASDGILFCEIGINQGKNLKALVKKYLPKYHVEVFGDYSKIDRIAVIKK